MEKKKMLELTNCKVDKPHSVDLLKLKVKFASLQVGRFAVPL